MLRELPGYNIDPSLRMPMASPLISQGVNHKHWSAWESNGQTNKHFFSNKFLLDFFGVK
jgi:hypothetical protein